MRLDHPREDPERGAGGELFPEQGAGGGFVRRGAGERQHRDGEAKDELPGVVGAAAAEDLDGLEDLERVAGGAADGLVHRRDERLGVAPGAARDGEERVGEGAGVLGRPHERAGAALHVEDERRGALGELLGEDARGDERDGGDGARDVAQRVELAVGGGEAVGLADDRAADGRDDLAEARLGQAGVVAGDRLELVERAAGDAEAAAGDHRDGDAARGDERREGDRDLVADAAGGVLVGGGAAEAVPRERVAGAHHRVGEGERLGGRHPAEVDRHRERGHLVVREAAVGEPGDPLADVGLGERGAVALALDDPLGDELVAHRGQSSSTCSSRW